MPPLLYFGEDFPTLFKRIFKWGDYMDVKYLNPPLRYYQETAKDKFNFFLDGDSDAISSYAQKTKNNLLDVSNG